MNSRGRAQNLPSRALNDFDSIGNVVAHPGSYSQRRVARSDLASRHGTQKSVTPSFTSNTQQYEQRAVQAGLSTGHFKGAVKLGTQEFALRPDSKRLILGVGHEHRAEIWSIMQSPYYFSKRPPR